MIDRTRYPDLHKPSKGYVFVVTYGRSGSTLTQALLNSIPGYCIRGENAHATVRIAQMLHLLRNETNFSERRARLAAHKSGTARTGLGNVGTPRDPWYGAELMDPDQFGKGLFDTFVREILHLPDGVRVGGFKEIRYINDPKFLPYHLETLQEFFPSARLILQTRDHAAVAKSGWWQDKDPKVLARRLAVVDEAFHSYRASHDNCFHLDYSTYRQGAAALQPLFAFLDEPYDETMVRRVLETALGHGRPGEKTDQANASSGVSS